MAYRVRYPNKILILISVLISFNVRTNPEEGVLRTRHRGPVQRVRWILEAQDFSRFSDVFPRQTHVKPRLRHKIATAKKSKNFQDPLRRLQEGPKCPKTAPSRSPRRLQDRQRPPKNRPGPAQDRPWSPQDPPRPPQDPPRLAQDIPRTPRTTQYRPKYRPKTAQDPPKTASRAA